ncbi:hypothetical protein [Methanospirillum hungatei]|uniref:hypothetical protein n=1 Tax=Methanospirillum hungatei TaxID=2203 RepID=UPI0026EB8E97|nr:hypothetical protein [Methanospirillum hungatei]MCA1915885.1 hypothetical protein [Methanospirillum hungatei]
MDYTFQDILNQIFDKQKRDYLTITELKTSLPKNIENFLGPQPKKGTNKKFIERLKPHLSEAYTKHKKGASTYLLRAPIQDIIHAYIVQKTSVSIRNVSKKLPFQKELIADALNALVQSGAIQLKIVPTSRDYMIQILVPERPDPFREIKKAYDTIRMGKNYVKIFALRRFLNWPKHVFDSVIQSLWDAGVVELQASDPYLLTEDQRADSYMDKTHTLRILLIWRNE